MTAAPTKAILSFSSSTTLVAPAFIMFFTIYQNKVNVQCCWWYVTMYILSKTLDKKARKGRTFIGH